MRNVCLKAMVLALTFVGLASLAPRIEAQTIQTLVQFTNSWQYDQTGRQLPANWMSSAYTPDGQWGASSPGLLGFEPDTPAVYTIHAPISTPLNNSGSITTYYFRTTFNYAGSLANVALIATNLVDDGCAIYLNGLRVGGVRIPAGYNALNAAAFFAGGTEGALEVVTFTNVSALRVGQNLLAVEVHQSANPSSDNMFGMKLLSIVPTALQITSQPQSQTVSVGDPVTFSVGVSGGPVVYRWYKDNVIQSSTSNTLTIPITQVASAGNYQVIVSNILGAVSSSIATLTVVADTDGPQMLRAVIDNVPCAGGSSFGSNTINIIFTSSDGRDPCLDNVQQEALNALTVRLTNNYQLISATNPNVRIPILSILYSSALGALLNVDGSNANWNPKGEYYLIVNNIADGKGNNIAPNSVIPVSIRVSSSLMQMSATWFYYDCSDPGVCDPNSAAVYANEAWAKTNFVIDPTYWGSGSGIFAAESGIPEFNCGGDILRTTISFQFDPTLFRTTFIMPTNSSSSGELRLRFLYDDAMAVYLNGEFLYKERCNVPITQASRSTGTFVDNATCSTNVTVRVTNLRPGTNWLCAAVLQHATHEADTVFGFEMDLQSLQTSRAPTNYPWGAPPNNNGPRIVRTGSQTDAQGRYFVLSWPATNYGYNLMYSTNIVGTTSRADRNWYTNVANWIQVPDQSNPYTNRITPTPPGARRFYKLFREKLN